MSSNDEFLKKKQRELRSTSTTPKADGMVEIPAKVLDDLLLTQEKVASTITELANQIKKSNEARGQTTLE